MLGVGTYAVLVDANVWFSRTLRDWLGMLYTTPDHPPFVAFWTEDILAELIYHLRKQNPDWPGGRITQIRDLLAGTFEGGRIEDFTIDGEFRGRDPWDRHVHAAAVACRADALVTFNLQDFDQGEDTCCYELLHPDDFLLLVDDADPGLVRTVASAMCAYWVRRNGSADLPARLRAAGCPRFAERILGHLGRMM